MGTVVANEEPWHRSRSDSIQVGGRAPFFGAGDVVLHGCGEERRLVASAHHPAVPVDGELHHVDLGRRAELQGARDGPAAEGSAVLPWSKDDVVVRALIGRPRTAVASVVLDRASLGKVVWSGDLQHRHIDPRQAVLSRTPLGAPRGVLWRGVHLFGQAPGAAETLVQRPEGLVRVKGLGQPGDVHIHLGDQSLRQALARREHAPRELVVDGDPTRARCEATHRGDSRDDGAQVGWVPGCRGPLVLPRIRPTEHRHVTVAPRLGRHPLDEVVAVVGLLAAVAEEDTLRVAPATAIDRHEREAFSAELHALRRPRVARVRRELEDRGHTAGSLPRQEDVGGESSPVAHGDPLEEERLDLGPRAGRLGVWAFHHGHWRLLPFALLIGDTYPLLYSLPRGKVRTAGSSPRCST